MTTSSTAGKWLQDGSLLYRLKDGVNHDQINVVQIDGRYSTDETKWAALEIRRRLNSYDTMTARIQSLEAALKNLINTYGDNHPLKVWVEARQALGVSHE